MALQLAAANRWLRFETGASQRIRVLLAMNGSLFKVSETKADQTWVSINELNAGEVWWSPIPYQRSIPP